MLFRSDALKKIGINFTDLKKQSHTKIVDPAMFESAFTKLKDPTISAEEKATWIDYIKATSTSMTSGANTSFPVAATSGGSLALTGVLGNHQFEAILKAVENNSTSSTLAAPRVTVVNNQSAKIREGTTLRYFKEYQPITTTSGTTNTASVMTNAPSGEPAELPPR